ncbi:hypothetical protein D3C72_1552210 [compost metagenome]
MLYPEGIRVLAEYVAAECQSRDLKFAFSIVTNGTLLTEENIRLLNEISCDVTISIDGPAEYNDLVRIQKNGTGSTDLVVDGAVRLAKMRQHIQRISFHGVFGKDNMQPYKAYKFYQTFGFDSYEFTYDVSTPDSSLNAEFISQLRQIAQEAFLLGGEIELRKVMFFDSVFSILDAHIFTCPWEVGQEQEKVGEGAYLSAVKLAPYQQPLVEKNDCGKCWARFVCGGGCMYIHKQTTGVKYKKDPIFCDRIRSLILTSIMYYKQSRETC